MDLKLPNFTLFNSSKDEINRKLLEIFFPNIIIIGIYIFTGIFGNSLVISVYLRKMGQTTDNRFFIPCLAVGDMLACVVSGVSAILMYIFHVQFTNETACKIMWFSMTWTACGAALILVFIALQRYIKICKPLCQIKLLDKKFTILVCLYLFSITVSSPLLFTAGITTVNYTSDDITLNICERINNDVRSNWKFNLAIAFTTIEALLVVTMATLLTTFYLRVGLNLIQHFKSIGRKKYKAEVQSQDTEIESTSDFSVNKECKPTSTKTFQKKGTLKRLMLSRQMFNKRHRQTFIFIAISGICIVTYSPRLLLMILESANQNFWFNFDDNTTILRFLRFLNRLYIVNNIANPFLYAMFDYKFRTQLVMLFKCKR